MTAYGWRIPFVLGGVFGLYALYMRLRMHETEVFVDEVVHDDLQTKGGIWQTIKEHPKLLFQVIGLTMGATVLYYAWAISAPAYAINVLHVPAAGALWAGTAAQVVFLIVLPLWGIVSDRIGRKPVLLTAMLGMAVLSFPLNAMLRTSPWSLFVAMSIALVFLGRVLVDRARRLRRDLPDADPRGRARGAVLHRRRALRRHRAVPADLLRQPGHDQHVHLVRRRPRPAVRPGRPHPAGNQGHRPQGPVGRRARVGASRSAAMG